MYLSFYLLLLLILFIFQIPHYSYAGGWYPSSTTIQQHQHKDPISLNYISVLLPKPSQNSNPEPIKLKGYGERGCFKWETNSPQIVDIRPSKCNDDDDDDNDEGSSDHEEDHDINRCKKLKCPKGSSTSVLLYAAISSSNDRKNAWVWAEEIDTGHRAECEVFVDCVHRLEVLTSTRVINVGDIESLDIQAFDDHDNVFTSVEGLPFRWSNNAEHILSFVALHEGLITVSSARQQLESKGYGSDRRLVKGMKTGRSTISATLVNDHCENHSVHPVNVNFSVVEPLFLTPTYANLLPHCRLTFELASRIRDLHTMRTRQQPIPLDSSQYRWSSSNDTALELIREGSVIALELGNSKVAVTDVNLPQHSKEADIIISKPEKLFLKLYLATATTTNIEEDIESSSQQKQQMELAIRQCNEDYLVTGQKYIFHIDILDIQGRIMNLCNGIKFNFILESNDSSILYEEMPQIKGDTTTYRYLVTAVSSGNANLSISLDRVINSEYSDYIFDNILYLKRKFKILTKIDILTKNIVLPASTGVMSSKQQHSYKLIATGGSMLYEWNTLKKKIISVNSHGLITTINEGTDIIEVHDRCTPENTAQAVVSVSSPSELHFLPGQREFEIGTSLDLVVIISDHQGRSFVNCSLISLSLSYISSSKELITLTSSQCQPICQYDSKYSCCIININGTKLINPSFFDITAMITNSKSKRQRTMTTVSAFPSLKVYPSNILIAQDSTRCISWQGGPVLWSDTHSDMSRISSTTIENDENNNMYSVSYPSLDDDDDDDDDTESLTTTSRNNFAALLCHEPHNQTLELIVANSPSELNPHPVEATFHLQFNCFPRLLLTPRKLSLGVGGRHQFFIVADHPLKNNVSFTSRNSSIVNVDSTGAVHGKSLGITSLQATIDARKLPCIQDVDDGLNDEIPIIIEFQDFRIKSSTSRLLQGEKTCFHIEDINNNIPSDEAFASLSCEWSTDSKSIELFAPLRSTSTSHIFPTPQQQQQPDSNKPDGFKEVKSFTACALGIQVSKKVVITATITTSIPNVITFKPQLELSVLEPLIIKSPHFVLLPYQASSKIHTSLDDSDVKLSFHVLSPKELPLFYNEHNESSSSRLPPLPISIDQRGLITARHHSGDALVVVTTGSTSKESLGDSSSSSNTEIDNDSLQQRDTVLVSVRPINELSVIASTPLPYDFMCVGSNTSLHVVLLDGLGRPFTSVEGCNDLITRLKIESSNPSVLEASLIHIPEYRQVVDGSSKTALLAILLLSAIEEGNTVLTLSLPQTTTQATTTKEIYPLYIRVNVANTTACGEPVAVRVSFRLFYVKDIGIDHIKRKEFESDLKDDLSRTLSVPTKRMTLINIDPLSGIVELDILPGDKRPPLPLALAQELRLQASDKHSSFRRSITIRTLDISFELKIHVLSLSSNESQQQQQEEDIQQQLSLSLWADEREKEMKQLVEEKLERSQHPQLQQGSNMKPEDFYHQQQQQQSVHYISFPTSFAPISTFYIVVITAVLAAVLILLFFPALLKFSSSDSNLGGGSYIGGRNSQSLHEINLLSRPIGTHFDASPSPRTNNITTTPSGGPNLPQLSPHSTTFATPHSTSARFGKRKWGIGATEAREDIRQLNTSSQILDSSRLGGGGNNVGGSERNGPGFLSENYLRTSKFYDPSHSDVTSTPSMMRSQDLYSF